MKHLPLLLLAILCVNTNLRSNTLIVNSNMYGIDHNNKLIVINQPIEEINSAINESLNTIQLDDEYKLEQSTTHLEIGHPYTVTQLSSDKKYKLYLTELPLIHINTDNIIVDEPRVLAHFRLTEGNGTEVSSNIGIEYRGAFSQTYPKKSFRIEFWEGEDDAITKDVSLLGLRSDDDWNLQAMYNEPLRIQSKTSNDLWREINSLYYQDKEPEAINGIRMEYAELFVNGDYRGVYCVGERVDRKQLKLKKYKKEVRGELYKGVAWQGTVYTSCPDYDNDLDIWAGFEYDYPDEIPIDWSRLHGYVNFVVNSTKSKFNAGYESQIVVSNAIDYFIFLNLIRATDNTGKNLYVAKYTNKDPYFFVPWDLDGVFGTIWNGTREDITTDILTNGLYKRLVVNSNFQSQLNNRWSHLRNSKVIDSERLMNMLKKNHSYLEMNAVYEKEIIAWEMGFLDLGELDYIETWIKKRIDYLDKYFSYTPQSIIPSEGDSNITFFLNPQSRHLVVNTNYTDLLTIRVYNLYGQSIKTVYSENKQCIEIPYDDISNGIYTISFSGKDLLKTEKIIINN